MHNQRGFIGVGVLVAILIGIVVLGGGAYYVVNQQSTAQTASENFDNVQALPANTTTSNPAPTKTQTTNTPTQTQSAPANTSPFATINQASLTTNLRYAKITGACGNTVGTIAIYVIRGKVSLPSTSLPSGDVVWSDSTTPGQTLDANCKSGTGTFSTKEIPTIQGVYTVGIYNIYKFATTNAEAGIQLLASANLNSNYQTADVMPATVGQCVTTTVKSAETYSSPQASGNMSFIEYTTIDPSGYSVHQSSGVVISGIANSREGDSVQLCVKAFAKGCPATYDSGALLTAKNLRTNETWEAATISHFPTCSTGGF